jgi:hypothetical protein
MEHVDTRMQIVRGTGGVFVGHYCSTCVESFAFFCPNKYSNVQDLLQRSCAAIKLSSIRNLAPLWCIVNDKQPVIPLLLEFFTIILYLTSCFDEISYYHSGTKLSYITRNRANIWQNLYETIMHNAEDRHSTYTYTYIRTYVRGSTDILLVSSVPDTRHHYVMIYHYT